MNQIVNSITVILSAVVGIAILSVILSRNSNTSGVISSGASGFAKILGAAEGPVSGSGIGGDLGGIDFGNGVGWG